LSCAVNPGFLFIDFIENGSWDIGGEFILIVGGAASHGKYFACFDFDCDDSTGFSFEGIFCGFLDVDIDTCCEGGAFNGDFFFDELVLETLWVDLEDFSATGTLKLLIEAFF